jgi:hypothetical protein
LKIIKEDKHLASVILAMQLNMNYFNIIVSQISLYLYYIYIYILLHKKLGLMKLVVTSLKIIKEDKHLASVILAMQKDFIVNLKTLIQFCNFCKFYTNFYITEFLSLCHKFLYIYIIYIYIYCFIRSLDLWSWLQQAFE